MCRKAVILHFNMSRRLQKAYQYRSKQFWQPEIQHPKNELTQSSELTQILKCRWYKNMHYKYNADKVNLFLHLNFMMSAICILFDVSIVLTECQPRNLREGFLKICRTNITQLCFAILRYHSFNHNV